MAVTVEYDRTKYGTPELDDNRWIVTFTHSAHEIRGREVPREVEHARYPGRHQAMIAAMSPIREEAWCPNEEYCPRKIALEV
jgi:hypothetical protein